MTGNPETIRTLEHCLEVVAAARLTHLDLLPRLEPVEKLIELELHGPPPGCTGEIAGALAGLARALCAVDTGTVKVVVIGGGTGLSNIVGGDSRGESWPRDPFGGLKEIFPRIRSIVCTTDDGGSTGELLKDVPLIALGDIRHVLLSSIQRQPLQKCCSIGREKGLEVAGCLHRLFNHRFTSRPVGPEALLDAAAMAPGLLPSPLDQGLRRLLTALFEDPRLTRLLDRPHCLGNLLLTAAIYRHHPAGAQEADPSLCCRLDTPVSESAILAGLADLTAMVGLDPRTVMPCTITPARLQMLYGNGVLVTGEYKSAQARRGFPVDRMFVEYGDEPRVPAAVLASLDEADIILLAPGSLYTSILPVLNVPGLAEAIRGNDKALKVLIANLWAQPGETDVAWDDPDRRYHISDLLKAYRRNVPGGVTSLFDHVLTMGLRDIPGSILRNYAVQGKVPIYLDRHRVVEMGFAPIEASIFSNRALQERRVVQHDPTALARAIRTLWALSRCRDRETLMPSSRSEAGPAGAAVAPHEPPHPILINPDHRFLCQRFTALVDRLQHLSLTGDPAGSSAGDPTGLPASAPPPAPSTARPEAPLAIEDIRQVLTELLWYHQDIPVDHLALVRGVRLIDRISWQRCQEWDNVFSFYDPADGLLKIRQDIINQPERFRMACLVALAQSLLGDYAAEKRCEPVEQGGRLLGKVFYLTLRPVADRRCYFTASQLDTYLRLARMVPVKGNPLLYSRLVNGEEGFTPPGLLFGLTYAWYLGLKFTDHIDTKMAVIKHEVSDLIPEQIKIRARRQRLIAFFRNIVFRHNALPSSFTTPR